MYTPLQVTTLSTLVCLSLTAKKHPGVCQPNGKKTVTLETHFLTDVKSMEHFQTNKCLFFDVIDLFYLLEKICFERGSAFNKKQKHTQKQKQN